MIKYPIRKFFGLTVLYIVIILGIFLLQFRSDTSISTTFGELRLQLTEVQNSDQEQLLRNRFQVSFKGLILSSDASNPVKITDKNGNVTDAVLSGWTENSPLSCTLTFDNTIKLNFDVSDDTQNSALSVTAVLPEQIESLSIPYKPATGFLVTDQTEKHTIFTSKTFQYEAEAANVTADRIILTKKHSLAKYNLYDPAKMFEFSSVHGLASATAESYKTTIRQFKTDLIRLFNPVGSESLPEQTIVSYVAAMAENGSYSDAIAQLPTEVKTSTRRSFLSAPYFNSLVAMNKSLVMFIDNRKEMINNAAEQQTLDIFTLHDLAELLCITNSSVAKKLLAFPATLTEFEPTIPQASGIIYTYTRLAALNKSLAENLAPVLDACLSKIAKSCTLEDEIISIKDSNNSLTLMDYASLGTALIEYGKLTDNADYSATGYLIINSYFNGNPSVNDSLRTLAELYPILEPNNTFYPHIQIIADSAVSGTNKPVWAWTVAKNIEYKRDSERNLTLSIDFPQKDTQYLIINGIEPFRRIDIYDMAFRTDPRFETYKSSGYVYNGETKTFFLKSLHRSAKEEIKLYYDKPAPKNDSTGNVPAESAQKTSDTEVQSSNTNE
ncbi:MAG: hypothetical protein IKZ04_03600 [Spirochaetaceae bacterium]|nr:hypothetical protein [Spirochaetaceae bacterium]